ncbi:MAG: VanZ family protein [bacterium]
MGSGSDRLPIISVACRSSQRMTLMATQSLQQRLWRYLPLIFWMAFIFYASTNEFSASNTSRIIRPLLLWLYPNISEERIALAHFFTRKAAHFTEYAVLGLLAARAFSRSSHRLIRRYWVQFAALLIVVYGLSDEYHQTFVPSRTGSIYDSAVDTAGGLFALLVFLYLRRRWNTRSHRDPSSY